MRARSIMACLSIVLVGIFIITTQTSSSVKVQARTYNTALDDTSPISLSEDVSSPQAVYGDILTYTISLTNTTVITLLNLLVTDTLPSSLSVISTSLWASQGTAQYSSSVITWSDTLISSTTISISFQAQAVRANTTITNSFLVDAGGFGIYTGPTVSTNIAPVQSFLPIVFNNYCSGPFIDDFSNSASGWPVGDTTYWSYGYLNGEYRFHAKTSAYGGVTRGDIGKPVVEVDARQASTVNGSYGIAFFINNDWSNYFVFKIHPATQEYLIGLWSPGYPGGFYPMYAGTSGAIHLNQDTNHLQIALHTPEIVGMDTYGFYINGTQVGQDWGWPTTTDLRVGLMAVSDAAGFDARFDNYKFVPEGCPANSQSSMRQPGKSPTQMFELPLISLPSQRAWPIRLNHAQPLIDR